MASEKGEVDELGARVEMPVTLEHSFQTQYGSHAEVAMHPAVAFDDRQAVLEALVADRKRDLDEARRSASQVMEIGQEHRRALRELLGGEGYGQLRAYLTDERRRRAREWEPPRGPDLSPAEREKAEGERRVRGDAFLRRLRAKPEQMQAISKATRQRLAKMAPGPQMREGAPVQLVPEKDVPEDIRAEKTNPWTIVQAPYPGWSWSYSGYLAGFGFTPTLALNSAGGLVGNSNYLYNSSSGDFDFGYVGYNASVGFWYQMPAAGLIEVWVYGQSGSSHHHVSLFDEWGWSDSYVSQNNYLTLKASGGGSNSSLRTSRMSWFWEDGYNSGSWDNHYLVDGNRYWAHLFTDVSYPAGAWVWVEVGTRNWNYVFSNDVSTYSDISFNWEIERVYLDAS